MLSRWRASFRHWRDRLGLERLAAALLFVAAATIACLMPVQSDTWWQLRAGQDFWQSGAIPLEDTYTHTAAGRFWMNHEWLSEVLFYGLFSLGGLPLVTTVAAIVVMGSFALSWSMMTGSPLLKLALMGGAVGTMSIAWTPRPHVFTLLLVTVCAWLMVSGRRLWLPLLFLVWANLHGGFTLGILIVGGAVLSSLPEGYRTARTWGLLLAACVVATLATPLGVSFWEELPASLARLREYQVLEWRRASLTNFALIPFWLAGGALVILVLMRRHHLWQTPTDRLLTVAAVLLLPLALSSIRNIPPFLLLALPAVTRLLPPRLTSYRETPVGRVQANGHLAVFGVTGALALGVVATAWTTPWERLEWRPVPRAALAAVDTCAGRLYNSYDDGGYLIWFAPHRKVFIDSRQDPFPVELVRQDMRAMLEGDYQETFAEHDIECAFVRSAAPLARRLGDDGWTPLYEGPKWTVYRQ